MGVMKYFLIFFTFIIPLSSHGQAQSYTLNGLMHVKNGETFPYQLVFHLSGNSIEGYSLTKLTNGVRPKIAIEGQVDVPRQLITISEKKLINKLPDNFTMCLLDATLNYKEKAKHVLSGNFFGMDTDHNSCGEGSLEFDQCQAINDLFKLDVIKQQELQAIKAYKDTIVITEPTAEFEITHGVTRRLEWITDTCTLEVFDGELVDGDEVTINFNGRNLLTDYTLTKQKKQLKLVMRKGVNTITIVAGYEGTSPPNTADIILFDKYKKYKIKAFNNAGEKATITINRK